MPFSYVLLDADNTLFNFDLAERHAVSMVLERCGVPAPGAQERFSVINKGLWLRLEKDEIAPEELRILRFRLLLQELGSSMDPRDAAAIFLTGLSESCFVLPRSLGVLQALRRRRVPTAIVTNGFSVVQRRRLALSGLAPYLDAVVISEEAGVQKPDPALVELALSGLGCKEKSQAVLVGDSLSSDMAAARNAGIAGVWYNPRRQERPKGAPFYEITDLNTLLTLIRS